MWQGRSPGLFMLLAALTGLVLSGCAGWSTDPERRIEEVVAEWQSSEQRVTEAEQMISEGRRQIRNGKREIRKAERERAKAEEVMGKVEDSYLFARALVASARTRKEADREGQALVRLERELEAAREILDRADERERLGRRDMREGEWMIAKGEVLKIESERDLEAAKREYRALKVASRGR